MALLELNMLNTIDQIPDNTIVRVVYASKLSLESRLRASILKKIEATACQYNQKNEITGELYYGNGYFLQCLEGAKQTVIELLKRIYEDKRHKVLKVLMVQPIEMRKFKELSMRLIVVDCWCLSAKNKQKNRQLDLFLPFKPHEWSYEFAENFFSVTRKLEIPSFNSENCMTLNSVSNVILEVVERHKVFLLVQGVLSIMFIIGLILLSRIPWL